MVVGYPPFFSDDAVTTCQKIVNWRKYLKYPEGVRATFAWVAPHAAATLNGLKKVCLCSTTFIQL